jgi:hypothetical protein
MTLVLMLSLPGPLSSIIQPATQQPSMRRLTAGDPSLPVAPDALKAGPARYAAACVAPRPVLRAESFFEPTIAQMWQRSPTFRRQVTRLVASGLIVTIEKCWTQCSGSLRAQTTVTYQHGVLARANVQIQLRLSEMPELIAHELEHVIEQLDGVDLVRLASRGSRLVNVDQSGHYETARADHIGRTVAAEYRAGVEMAPACERTTP